MQHALLRPWAPPSGTALPIRRATDRPAVRRYPSTSLSGSASRHPSLLPSLHASDLTGLLDALQDVDAVFLVRVPGSDGVAGLARELGVGRLVLLSSAAVELGDGNAIARAHRESEEAIRTSGVSIGPKILSSIGTKFPTRASS